MVRDLGDHLRVVARALDDLDPAPPGAGPHRIGEPVRIMGQDSPALPLDGAFEGSLRPWGLRFVVERDGVAPTMVDTVMDDVAGPRLSAFSRNDLSAAYLAALALAGRERPGEEPEVLLLPMLGASAIRMRPSMAVVPYLDVDGDPDLAGTPRLDEGYLARADARARGRTGRVDGTGTIGGG